MAPGSVSVRAKADSFTPSRWIDPVLPERTCTVAGKTSFPSASAGTEVRLKVVGVETGVPSVKVTSAAPPSGIRT